MRMSRGWSGSHLVVATILLSAATSAAHADPITSDGYTITDLGPGTPTFSTDSNGNGIVIAPNGQMAYSFPETANTVLTPGQGIMANFPQFPATRGAGDYGNPAYDYNNVLGGAMNSSGLAVVTDQAGVAGHGYTISEIAIQRNADGSWGQPVTVVSSTEQYEGGGLRDLTTALLSKSNQILAYNVPGGSSIYHPFLYNFNTSSTTDLMKVLTSVNSSYVSLQPIAIDDLGRILFTATSQNPGLFLPTQTNLLFTPVGVSSDPIDLSVPEPSTVAVFLIAIVGYGACRWPRGDLAKSE
jgi:hypothetical protein